MDSLDKQIAELNLLLEDYEGKNLLVTGLDKSDDYSKLISFHKIGRNKSNDTYHVKVVFDDGEKLEYPNVDEIKINEDFKPKVWIHEKGMSEFHHKIVFGEECATYVTVINP